MGVLTQITENESKNRARADRTWRLWAPKREQSEHGNTRQGDQTRPCVPSGTVADGGHAWAVWAQQCRQCVGTKF